MLKTLSILLQHNRICMKFGTWYPYTVSWVG